MHFKQFYVGCLAHASYLIGDGGEAAVVDPSRDVQMYLDEAAAHGLTIRWILETHLHADFVSGHRELAARTGATIAIGAKAEPGYAHHPLREGDEVRVGGVVIRALETPGHTPESLCFLVYEHAGDEKPWAVLTGDTLFVGDVGRVDILSSRLPVTELAGMMYDSLHGKLLKLPDETLVYPAHGAGSLCGKSISQDSSSTIGRERRMNAALAERGRDAFIAEITRDVPETPVYFLHSRDLNKAGPSLDAQRPFPPSLTPRDVEARIAKGAVLLDTRPTEAFAECHPRGALSVSLDGQYASWVGTLVRPDEEIILVVEPDRAEEAVMRLARVGYERVTGILEGGCERWVAEGLPTQSVTMVPSSALSMTESHVLDVRRPSEYARFRLPLSTFIPLAKLPKELSELDHDAEWKVTCASGYRSMIAASILQRAGFAHVRSVKGGLDAYRASRLPVDEGLPVD
ncbi:MAG TPA: rhodanese-like domain-containing protein [Candidatus Eisenbacteria bacterium]|nr:rhodanese-like domain-containing protein [Candidatus Eisenbacteria bacterium]